MQAQLLFGQETLGEQWPPESPLWQMRWSHSRARGNLCSRLTKDEQTKAMSELFSHPWFWRTWIIQEVARARSAVIYCAGSRVSSRVFAVMPVLLSTEVGTHQQSIIDIMPGLSRRTSWWTEDRSLSNLLLKFRRSEAWFSRDRIYALLGICSDLEARQTLAPDYQKSDDEVARDAVAFLYPVPRVALNNSRFPFDDPLQSPGRHMAKWPVDINNHEDTVMFETETFPRFIFSEPGELTFYQDQSENMSSAFPSFAEGLTKRRHTRYPLAHAQQLDVDLESIGPFDELRALLRADTRTADLCRFLVVPSVIQHVLSTVVGPTDIKSVLTWQQAARIVFEIDTEIHTIGSLAPDIQNMTSQYAEAQDEEEDGSAAYLSQFACSIRTPGSQENNIPRSGRSIGLSALTRAAAMGDAITVEVLISRGTIISEPDDYGLTALMWAQHLKQQGMTHLLKGNTCLPKYSIIPFTAWLEYSRDVLNNQKASRRSYHAQRLELEGHNLIEDFVRQ